MKYILISTLIFAACTTTKKNSNGCKSEPVKDCMATMEYKPVCGCDGKTYSNAGVAKCAGVNNWTEGACNK